MIEKLIEVFEFDGPHLARKRPIELSGSCGPDSRGVGSR
jgi:hypothetical protein